MSKKTLSSEIQDLFTEGLPDNRRASQQADIFLNGEAGLPVSSSVDDFFNFYLSVSKAPEPFADISTPLLVDESEK